jgi:hypothetical protein
LRDFCDLLLQLDFYRHLLAEFWKTLAVNTAGMHPAAR